MVVNTNDPDYEHIYSIESYNDDVDELLYIAPSGSNSNGAVSSGFRNACSFWDTVLYSLSPQGYLCWLCIFFFVCALTGATAQETDETDNFELNSSANDSNAEPTIDAGQKRLKVAPKANRSVRFKRSASGNGKLAHGPGGPGGGCFIVCLKKSWDDQMKPFSRWTDTRPPCQRLFEADSYRLHLSSEKNEWIFQMRTRAAGNQGHYQ